MGYETTLMFIDTYGKKIGFMNVIATIHLEKISYYNNFCKLLSRFKKRKFSKKVEFLIENYLSEEGNIDKIEQELEEKLPFIFIGDKIHFCDDYGDILMVCDLEKLKSVLYKVIIEAEKNDYVCSMTAIAISMIEKLSELKNIKVILWGS